MQSILENVPQLAAYSSALLAIVVLCMAIIVQSFLAGVLALAPGHEVAGLPLKGSHEDRPFRLMRAYGNSTENIGFFIATVAVAIIAGVDATWVNGLVMAHVAFRVLHWVIYVAGIGNPVGGPRSIVYVLGLVSNGILAVMAIWALIA